MYVCMYVCMKSNLLCGGRVTCSRFSEPSASTTEPARFQAQTYSSPPPGSLLREQTEGKTLFQVIRVDYAGPWSTALKQRWNGKPISYYTAVVWPVPGQRQQSYVSIDWPEDMPRWPNSMGATFEKEASLAELIAWMNTEMKSRVRAKAALRNSRPEAFRELSSKDDNLWTGLSSPKCWKCKNPIHKIDQCQKFMALDMPKIESRLLKKTTPVLAAWKEQEGSTGPQKVQGEDCSETSDGNQYKCNHHPLLHETLKATVATVAFTNRKTAKHQVIGRREEMPNLNLTWEFDQCIWLFTVIVFYR